MCSGNSVLCDHCRDQLHGMVFFMGSIPSSPLKGFLHELPLNLSIKFSDEAQLLRMTESMALRVSFVILINDAAAFLNSLLAAENRIRLQSPLYGTYFPLLLPLCLTYSVSLAFLLRWKGVRAMKDAVWVYRRVREVLGALDARFPEGLRSETFASHGW